MATVEIKAHELTNTDVSFVSLVKRGANRIPFRIVKGDAEMFDLAKVGRKLFNKADLGVHVVAVIAQKDDELTSTRAQLIAKSVGFEKSALNKADDGVIALVKSGSSTEKSVLVKLDSNFALAVAGSNVLAAMGQHDFKDSLFKDVDGSKGYVIGPYAAYRMFKGASEAIMDGASDPSVLSTTFAKAADDFKAYSTALGIGLPAIVAKADHLVKDWNDMDGDDTDGEGGDDSDTGDDNGKDGKKPAKKASSLGDKLSDEGDPGATDPLMPAKDAAKKADAGKNGTGAGFAAPDSNIGATTDSATADDKANTEINAKPGGKVSGTDTGLPAKLMAQKLDAVASVLKSMGFEATITKGEGGAHIINVRTIEIHGESAAGEGAAGAVDKRPEANATADDAKNAGGAITGKVRGATLDMNGIPAKLKAPTMKADGTPMVEDDDSTNGAQSDLDAKLKAKKNDGDAAIGKKGQGNLLDDDLSGAGAQEDDVQTLKGDDAVMLAVRALAKSVQESNAAVTKSVSALAARVETVAVMAKKTDAALNGTVLVDAGEDRVGARKHDAPSAPPLLDTGFSRRK